MKDITHVYKTLKLCNIISTQEQFSTAFMGKSPRYYSYIVSTKRAPSIHTVYALALRLEILTERFAHAGNHKTALIIGELAMLMHENVKMRSLASLPITRPRTSHPTV